VTGRLDGLNGFLRTVMPASSGVRLPVRSLHVRWKQTEGRASGPPSFGVELSKSRDAIAGKAAPVQSHTCVFDYRNIYDSFYFNWRRSSKRRNEKGRLGVAPGGLPLTHPEIRLGSCLLVRRLTARLPSDRAGQHDE
jgi:hypothetical protein